MNSQQDHELLMRLHEINGFIKSYFESSSNMQIDGFCRGKIIIVGFLEYFESYIFRYL